MIKFQLILINLLIPDRYFIFLAQHYLIFPNQNNYKHCHIPLHICPGFDTEELGYLTVWLHLDDLYLIPEKRTISLKIR